MAVPGLLKHFTTADINALICPRAHLSLAGVYDRLTPPAGLDRVDAALQQVYADAGVPERWQLVRYSSGHFETWDMRPAHLRRHDGRGQVGKSGRLTAVSERHVGSSSRGVFPGVGGLHWKRAFIGAHHQPDTRLEGTQFVRVRQSSAEERLPTSQPRGSGQGPNPIGCYRQLRASPPGVLQGAVGTAGPIERGECCHVLLREREVEDLGIFLDALAVG